MARADTSWTGLARWLYQRTLATVVFLIGAILAWLGAQLVQAEGSPYYLMTGVVLIGSGVLLWRGDRRGAWLFYGMLVYTTIWAFWEVGADGWALAPRIVVPAVFGLALLVPWAYDRGADALTKPAKWCALAAVFGPLVLTAIVAFQHPGDEIAPRLGASPLAAKGVDRSPDDWMFYGNDQGGLRHSALKQITPQNVGELSEAWVFHTGFKRRTKMATFEATPIKVGNSLYLCTANNDVIAVDAETGRLRWRFDPKADLSETFLGVCRGVAYYRNPSASPDAPCAARIISGTLDGRLLAIDARNGVPCPGFGNEGVVNLLDLLGPVEKGYYALTSQPQIIRGNIVVGGYINDNQHTNEQSGVVRAFDAVTGKFVWAFDIGRPDDHGLPPGGQAFTLGTPNSWAPLSADESLGLVYVPTGNATPDWFGGQRRPLDDKYSSSLIALDATNGAVKWSFQTTHHDLWDYDVPSQPTLYDFPMPDGRRVPAVVQPTKRGEIFVLDRRTGEPLTTVVERPVPRSVVPGERASPTQPFSVGMPSVAGPPLTERMMWGMTPIDQAWCRLAFRRAHYEGTMTPVRIGQPAIAYPGYMGGVDWGSVSIDPVRDIMIVNANRFALMSSLLTRKEADRAGLQPMSVGVEGDPSGAAAQAGTPYGVRLAPFMSPLQIPCQQPPYGTITAIDLKSRTELWEKPLGTAREGGPFRLPLGLPFRMGVPNTGGSISTGSGLVFIAATQDRYFRAFDIATGKELWRASLPAAGMATPMTYLTPRTGRQMVVIAAGGHEAYVTRTSDSLVAFALPSEAQRRGQNR